MEYSEKTKTLVKEARSAADKARDEIAELQKELTAGTLDRQKLESGLQELCEYVTIMQRVPPHSN
jgi:hypothetical protein